MAWLRACSAAAAFVVGIARIGEEVGLIWPTTPRGATRGVSATMLAQTRQICELVAA